MTDAQSSLRLLLDDAAPYREALEHHSLYQELTSLTRIRCFLEHHVFAVWDFMSLIKGLQRHLTRVEAPWLPVGDARIRRLINEVVLAEESDALPDGRVCSHFELYREAMQSAGADVSPVALFTEALERGLPATEALRKARAPHAAQAFVAETLDVVERNQPHELAAVFAIGREQMIPAMFVRIVEAFAQSHPDELRPFHLYLRRHIEVDAAEHGPAALEMLAGLCGGDPAKWKEATAAAISALGSRRRFWDGILGLVATQ
jgi:Protein of unknown function (DUF3050)